MNEFIREAWKSTDANRFPGPQPVSIERRHFALLKRQPYFVCEKTDGVRQFLIGATEGTFIVNRAFQVEPVKIRIPKDTLLDGELVRLKSGKMAFVVHDAVLVKGENLMDLPLDQRLEKARGVTKAIIKTATAPFEVRVKKMYKLFEEPIPDLNSFDYETDGIVMTPIEEPVRMGTHETMFKWKPRDRITIDFQLQNGFELFVQDRGEPYKEAELHLGNQRKDLPDGTIVECGYGNLGWFVEKVRTDKNHANNRRTFFRTIVNIRENIQLEEITGGTTPGKTLP
jgi:hypothetical protein